MSVPAFLLASSFSTQLYNSLFDDTFTGLYHLQPFDYLILLPYFAILILLSFYGLHRFEMIRGYLKHRKNFVTEAPQKFAQLPRVTIQLPLYNERYVVERLIEEVSHIDYPHELLQIQILDDSTDDTHPFTERLVGEYQAAGTAHPVYLHRTNRHGFKAGALQQGLETATGELVAVFDADFIPPRDFLRRTVDFFADPKVGVVQTRWAYLNRHYNLLTEVEAMLLDGHFVLEHGARSGGGLFFNFQWHGGHSAQDDDRRCRRLAARYAHRGFRFKLSRAVEGLAVRVRAVHRVRFRTACGYLRIPGAAVALGQGADAGGEKAVAGHFAIRIFQSGASWKRSCT